MSINQVVVSHTTLLNAAKAGQFLSSDVVEKLRGANPDVVIVFASREFSYVELLTAIESGWRPRILVGCSSAGEYSGCNDGNSSASIMAIKADDMRFNAIVGHSLRAHPLQAMDQVMPVFTGAANADFPYRSALVLIDALAGYTDDMILEMTVRTGGTYQLFGGGAADDARFQQTHVVLGTAVHDDAVVVLEMLSKRALGLGVRHGWEPSGPALWATEADGNTVVSLNAISAADVFSAHAERTGQVFKRDDPMPFFLHNVLESTPATATSCACRSRRARTAPSSARPRCRLAQPCA